MTWALGRWLYDGLYAQHVFVNALLLQSILIFHLFFILFILVE